MSTRKWGRETVNSPYSHPPFADTIALPQGGFPILAKSKEKQYIYIVQASKETAKCKIGKTNNLDGA
jgi:hypothetical protein